jgi:cyclic pyranopterin phosphate synthase
VTEVFKDPYGRTMRKLRISLTDACNFRCFYCMPKNVKFQPKEHFLSSKQIYAITKELVNLGIEELRLSGGDPTLREDLDDILQKLGTLNVSKLGLTSNAYLLAKHLPLMKEVDCKYVNISLDSLNADSFERITRTKHFETVFRTILQARDMGFSLKVNMVVMRGYNEQELMDFVHFSEEEGIEVRFLELMKIGPHHMSFDKLFVSADEMIEMIGQQRSLKRELTPYDSTSFNYRTPQGGRIGWIASESKPFCGACSRLRLTHDGQLRSCLMSRFGVSLRDVPFEDYPSLIRDVLQMKPSGRIPFIEQAMHEIGG